ncbi:MAG: PIG-L family deacetylase [Pyrinomonadaceae bacterium]|nr:PIG-L family deacetylase [Pyrinomonadaceae bacterium]
MKMKVARRIARANLSLLLLASLLVGALPSLKSFRAEAQKEALDAELYQSLLDLTNPWTVMCVAAHPDDEDGATLTVLRRKMGVHTVTLFSTYGEGGQNATGPELYEELGVIRARETEEASQIQGSEPYFLGLRDFGFSKSAEEAFRVWGHDEALRRMVLKIRELRPDVIITNHDTTGGHGHHQATGRLVLEAFDAAADPARFPEQLRDGRRQVWQVQRLFVRAGYEGGAATKALDDEAARTGKIITIDRNERDPVRGTTYAEQALQALRRHASQGPWPQKLPSQGWPAVRYRLAREAKGAAPLPPNAQTFLDNLSIPEEPVSKVVPLAVRAVLSLYESQKASREDLLMALASLRKSNVFAAPAGSKDAARFQLMNSRLDKALAVISGITAEFRPEGIPLLIPGTEMPYTVTLYNGGEQDVTIKRSAFRFHGSTLSSAAGDRLLQRNQPFQSKGTALVARDEFINTPQSAHLYDGHLWGEELGEEFLLEVEGAQFTVKAYKRFPVAPPVEIESIQPSPLVITPQTFRSNQAFTFSLNNHTTAPLDVRVRANQLVYAGRASEPAWVRVPARDSLKDEASYMLSSQDMKAIRERKELNTTARFSLHRVNADKQPPITEREVKIVYADAVVDTSLRVGFVRSTDFTLPAALAALGVQSKELTIDEIRAGNLGSYDAIIIDNRGYQAHPELVQLNQKLLDYTESGGTLIVFYHKTNEWNPDEKAARPQLAPFPIILGNSRVTDENAPVQFTEPLHPLLNFPNKISAQDFEGWIQERGLYFPKEWDKRYSAPLTMSDAGEPALNGGLLAADYGRGRYIYTSIVWYRQLREGIPGAYRVLANMISYGRTDKRQARQK